MYSEIEDYMAECLLTIESLGCIYKTSNSWQYDAFKALTFGEGGVSRNQVARGDYVDKMLTCPDKAKCYKCARRTDAINHFSKCLNTPTLLTNVTNHSVRNLMVILNSSSSVEARHGYSVARVVRFCKNNKVAGGPSCSRDLYRAFNAYYVDLNAFSAVGSDCPFKGFEIPRLDLDWAYHGDLNQIRCRFVFKSAIYEITGTCLVESPYLQLIPLYEPGHYVFDVVRSMGKTVDCEAYYKCVNAYNSSHVLPLIDIEVPVTKKRSMAMAASGLACWNRIYEMNNYFTDQTNDFVTNLLDSFVSKIYKCYTVKPGKHCIYTNVSYDIVGLASEDRTTVTINPQVLAAQISRCIKDENRRRLIRGIPSYLYQLISRVGHKE